MILHKKTGHKYQILAHCTNATNYCNGVPMVVYTPLSWKARLAAWLLQGCRVYVRDEDEFFVRFAFPRIVR